MVQYTMYPNVPKKRVKKWPRIHLDNKLRATFLTFQRAKWQTTLSHDFFSPDGGCEDGDVLHVRDGRDGVVSLQPEGRGLPLSLGHIRVGQADQRQRHTLQLLDATPEIMTRSFNSDT